ncbi:response regulator [Paenibacillus sp. HJGM_3]|uniref:response regulator transcription factor n=1 Tax=Paenibacillus sp. HJGM_3 TaxID=3379816 RepID=UPI003858BF19
MNLLLVDDEVHWLEGLSETIPWETVGIELVYKAQNGVEALRLLEQYPIEIVLTDVLMPEMSGIQLIERIRQTWSGTKCIILSGYAEFEYAQQALAQQATDYLLKPARDEVVIDAVRRAVNQWKEEWEQIASTERAVTALREHLPLLKGHLLEGLLTGGAMSPSEWEKKRDWYGLRIDRGSPYCLMMVRMEGRLAEVGVNDRSLYDYSIFNLADEIFARHFSLWCCRDKYGYLVFVATPAAAEATQGQPGTAKLLLEQCAIRLQRNVGYSLRSTISVLMSGWSVFPYGLASHYQAVLNTFRQQVGSEQEAFMGVAGETAAPEVKRLMRLYEPPRVVHLLEAGRWTELTDKLNEVFRELEESFANSQEHVLEAGHEIVGALLALAHKNGQRLSEWVSRDYDKLADGTVYRSIRELRQWTETAVAAMRADIEEERLHTRSGIVQKLQRFIEAHVAEDLSLQAMADHVYLHPTHLSKLYKAETGEMLSAFLYRYRMEKAAHLLSGSEEKIYRIGEQVGYPNAAYFIKVFKKTFGLTPQEYRDANPPTK